MSWRWLLLLAATLAGAALSTAVAQDPGDLSPDRPGFGESTEVVGKLAIEVEGGFVRESAGRGADREVTYSAPLTLLRFGVSRRLELRFEGDGYIRQTAHSPGDSSQISGLSDHSLGFKFKLRDEEGPWPNLSLLGNVSLPIGSEEFTSGGVDPEIKLIWSKNLPHAFSVSGTFNVSSVSDPDGRMLNRAVGVSAGHGLGGGFAGSWEVYRVDLERGQGASWTAASGLTHGLGKNEQLDLSAGHTLTGIRSGWFFTAGFAFRHPHLNSSH